MFIHHIQLIQKILQQYSYNVYSAMQKAVHDPLAAQDLLFDKVINNLIKSKYGAAHGISNKITYNQYCNLIPINTYDSLEPWILLTKQECNVLTADKIDFYAYTSGSSADKKIIPYTKSLRKSFSNAFKTWCCDCLIHKLTLKTGKIFMSISPPVNQKNLYDKQIQDDSEYLSGLIKYLVKHFLVTDHKIYNLFESDDFLLVLCLILLAEERLEIISLWSPSYLLIVLKYIEQNWDKLIDILALGQITLKNITFKFDVSKSRKTILHSLNNVNGLIWKLIWPNLKMLSCWDSATAKSSALQLKQYFPGTFIQGKGLLATEAPITIPLIMANGYVPMLQEVFFEFEDEAGKLFRLHELAINKKYEIIITQLGGLYRYRIGDYIKVTNFYFNTPCIEFIGRTKNTSDLVGEKLNEQFVSDIFNQPPFCLSSFIVLLPEQLRSGQGRYHLLTDYFDLLNHDHTLDKSLRKAFHYNNARNLSQLLNCKVYYHPDMRNIIREIMIGQGIKWGDQKEQFLIASISKSNLILNAIRVRSDIIENSEVGFIIS